MCYLRSDRSKQKGYYDERNSLYLCALHPLRAEITKRGRFNLSPNPICAFKNSTRNATVISLIQPDRCCLALQPTKGCVFIYLSEESAFTSLAVFGTSMVSARKQPTQAIHTKPTRPYYEPLFSQSPFPVTKAS